MADTTPLTYTEALHQTPLSTRLDRAKHHYTQRLTQLQTDHTQLDHLQHQYTQLNQQLTTLPTRLNPPHRVPFGPLAFFPGHLQHTNEWLVLLGGEYWLECTAARARRVVEGRAGELKRRLGRVKEEEKRVKEWMDEGERVLGETSGKRQAQDEDEEGAGDEIVEIKEEYKEDEDEEAERKGAADVDTAVADRAASLRAAGGMTDTEFNAYWDKLAELEEEEERQEETKVGSRGRTGTARHTAHGRDEEEELVVEEEEQPVALPAIRSPADIYKHMQQAAAQRPQQQQQQQQQPAASQPPIQSNPAPQHKKRVSFSSAQPAIALIDPVSTRPLRHHTHSPPPPATSLLPHDGRTAATSAGRSGVTPVSSNPALASAFSGAVLERDVVDGSGGVDMQPAPVVKKKMSRFMAERMGLKVDDD